MKYKQSTKITRTITEIGIIAIVVIFIWGLLSVVSSVNATSSDDWNEFLTGTIVDIDPVTSHIPSTGYFGLFFEMDNGRWIWLWKKEIEGEMAC